MRADWVPNGMDVTSRPFNPEPVAGSLVPGEVLPGERHLYQWVMRQASRGV